MSKRHMQHYSAVDGGASATDGYSPASEAPPPATRLLDLPPALLDDIACRAMQLQARTQLPLTCHAFSLAHLLHFPELRIQLGRQCCDQLLTPRVVAAVQGRTSELALTLWQPETEDSCCYRKQLAPMLQLAQTEYTQDYTDLLAHALAKLDNCAAVEVCELVSSGECHHSHLHCPPGLAQHLLDSFPSLTALTLEGLCVSSDALASLLSYPPLALQLQQLHLPDVSVPVGDEHRLLGPVFQGLQLKQLSIAAVRRKQPGTPPLPSFQPLAQHLTQLHLKSSMGYRDADLGYFREYLQPLAQLQVLTLSHSGDLEGLTQLLQALPQLHTLQLPWTSIMGQQQLDTLLAVTQFTSVQLATVMELGTSRADVPCSWQRLKLTGWVFLKQLAYLPLHSLSQPLVLGTLSISVEDTSDPELATAIHLLAYACKVPVQIKELQLRMRKDEEDAEDEEDEEEEEEDEEEEEGEKEEEEEEEEKEEEEEEEEAKAGLGPSVITPASLLQQRVDLAQLVALLQSLKSCGLCKVQVFKLHGVTAADVLALAPLCRDCTHFSLHGGSVEPSLEFWRQLVQLMPVVQKVEFYYAGGCVSAAMHESLQLMAEQPWARWLDITICYRIIASEPPACWQAGSWVKTGVFKVSMFDDDC